MAKIKMDKDTQLSKEYIEQINTKSRTMIDAMSDMLWTLNPENDTMEKTLLRMKECAQGLGTTYDTKIDMEVDTKVKSLKLDMKKRHELFFIFKEAIRSIAKQANGTASVVNIGLSNGNLLLKMQNQDVSFNSVLVDEATKNEMKQRAHTIGADLNIHEGKNSVSIILAVPV